MSEHDAAGASPDPDDPEQERVRRLLADLAATDERDPAPVPADLAARLDAALADLGAVVPGAAHETPAETLAPVVPLRRRLAPALATAAAVVVLAGGGGLLLTQVGDGSGGDAGGGSAASSSEDTSGSVESSRTSEESAGSGSDAGSPSESDSPAPPGALDDGSGSGSGSGTRMTPAPYVSRDSLAADVSALLGQGEVAAPGAEEAQAARQRVDGSGCVVPAPDDGAATLVSLEGDPAVLVVGEERDAERPVQVLACADGSVAARAQVPTG